MVGGSAPVVVQSMTNTDTADINATVAQVAALARAGSELVRITVDRARVRRRRPAHPRPPRRAGHHRPPHRRFPLHRPHAAHGKSRLRRGAGEVPHQSRQCRLRREEGPAVRDPHRDRDAERQAGAHRRQLGLARSGAPHAPDGRQRRAPDPRARQHRCSAKRSCSPPSSPPRRPRRSDYLARKSSSRRKSPACRTSSRSTPRSPRAPTTRSISASPRPAWAPRASSRRPPRWRSCCSRASATPSASRSRRSPAATARAR